MKLKWLLIPLCVFFVLQSCKKDSNLPKLTTTGPITRQKLTIANVLQSNMVIQRNKPFRIWGTSVVNAAITVKASWNYGTLTTKTDGAGNWSVTVPASGANAMPQTISVTNNSATISLNNILIGDVWVCAGQSNMVYEMEPETPFRGVLDYQSEIAAADNPAIRAITLQADYETTPVDTLMKPSGWQVCSPATVGGWSGVAYYFAQKLNTSLNIPVGIIISAVDGTSCEAWASKATFDANPALAVYSGINSATQLYNGMISPLTNLSVSGFIWYQGENNRHNDPPGQYTTLNSGMIVGWRNAFNQGLLPFYFVQMPPFADDYYNTTPVGGNLIADDYAKFREAQANIRAVPGTGMAITMDVGEPANQHPLNKKPIGERLALLALKNTYAQNIKCYGPQFLSYTASGNSVTINFMPGTADGLNTISNQPLSQYFFVSGTDHNFVQATAMISGNQVVLTVPQAVPLPVQAVRYAFTNAPVTNLQNSAGLPAEPFRTDDWVK